MVCIHCKSETKVTNSRHQKKSNKIWRRRQCLNCKAVFTTEETALYSNSWQVLDKSGKLKPFSRDKLFISLYRSSQHRKNALEDSASLTDTIIGKIANVVKSGTLSSKNIQQAVQIALNRFDNASSVHYRAFHNQD